MVDTETVRRRLLNNIDIIGKTGCWDWKLSKNSVGYGLIKVSGKMCLAHRLSYLIFRGEIPEGKLVCHKCDNRKCVNPEHLFLGSYSDNAQDMHKKGRGRNQNGEHNNLSKLTEKDVLEIRRLYATGNYTQTQLGEMFGVNYVTVSDICRKATWKHI